MFSSKGTTIIIGCGRLGAHLANDLSFRGKNVLVVDKDKNAFTKLSPTFTGITVEGDAMDYDILEKLDLKQAESVIVVSNEDNINILISQLIKEQFHMHKVIARLYDPEKIFVYRELNIDTICPATLSANAIEELLEEQ